MEVVILINNKCIIKTIEDNISLKISLLRNLEIQDYINKIKVFNKIPD